MDWLPEPIQQKPLSRQRQKTQKNGNVHYDAEVAVLGIRDPGFRKIQKKVSEDEYDIEELADADFYGIDGYGPARSQSSENE